MNDPSKDKFLIIETSTRAAQAALAEGDAIRARRSLEEARRHARDLAPAVKDVLQNQGWRPADIKAVLVSRGPGSYTGLRVGIMSAKAFAYATGCTILGIDTFAAIALQSEHSPVAVIADAQQEKVYHQTFECSTRNDLPAARTPLTILPISELLLQINPDVWLTGPGLQVHRNRIPDHFNMVEDDQWTPRPESLLRLALGRLARGESDDYWTLEPLYLRPSSAEEKWAK